MIRSLVEPVGTLEQSFDDPTNTVCVRWVCKHLGGIHTLRSQLVERQIDSTKPSVLANVAGNIGQLHCSAKICGARECLRIPDTHKHRHHDADSACDPSAVVINVFYGVIYFAVSIPGKTLEEGVQQCPWHMVSVYDLSQYSIGRLVLRLDLINTIKTIVKNF